MMNDRTIIFGFVLFLIFPSSDCRSNDGLVHGHTRGMEWIKGKRHVIQSLATNLQGGHIGGHEWVKGKRYIPITMNKGMRMPTFIYKSTKPREKLKSLSPQIFRKRFLTSGRGQKSYPSGKAVRTPSILHLQLLRKPRLHPLFTSGRNWYMWWFTKTSLRTP